MFHLANAAAMSYPFPGGRHAGGPARVHPGKASLRRSSAIKVTGHPAGADHDPDVRRSTLRQSRYDLSSLRLLIYGASPICEALLDRAIEKLPNDEFVQSYGKTELSPSATLLPWKDHIGAGRAKGRHRSAGRPITMVEVRIVDAGDRPVPPRVVGEIVARGETVMMGYWERPEETRRRSSTAGCTPGTAATWMKTAMCMSSTGSRT